MKEEAKGEREVLTQALERLHQEEELPPPKRILKEILELVFESTGGVASECEGVFTRLEETGGYNIPSELQKQYAKFYYQQLMAPPSEGAGRDHDLQKKWQCIVKAVKWNFGYFSAKQEED